MKWNDLDTQQKIKYVAGTLLAVGLAIIVLIIVGSAFMFLGPIWGSLILGVILAISGGIAYGISEDM